MHNERFAMGSQHQSVALVKPLGRRSDLAGGGTPAFFSPSVHPHAVGLLLDGRVHLLPRLGACQMRQPGPADQTARRFRGVVERRQDLPLAPARINIVISEFQPHRQGVQEVCQRNSLLKRRHRRVIDGAETIPHG